ncbi:MAG: periplasmic nitrate reductase, NapE protein [Rhodospirillales bacterium]
MTGNIPSGSGTASTRPSKTEELRTFLFLTVFLAPILAVGIVGGYGLLVWISQMLLGPPTG